jgi:hypothetical protein
VIRVDLRVKLVGEDDEEEEGGLAASRLPRLDDVNSGRFGEEMENNIRK